MPGLPFPGFILRSPSMPGLPFPGFILRSPSMPGLPVPAEQRAEIFAVIEQDVPDRRFAAVLKAQGRGKTLGRGTHRLKKSIRTRPLVDDLRIGKLQGGGYCLVFGNLRCYVVERPEQGHQQRSEHGSSETGSADADHPGGAKRKQGQECRNEREWHPPEKEDDHQGTQCRTGQIEKVMTTNGADLMVKNEGYGQAGKEERETVDEIGKGHQPDL